MEPTITPKSSHSSTEIEADFYTKEELRQFFDCLQELKDDRALSFFRLAAYTGVRKGEILGLTWKDIDFDKKTVQFNKTLVELSDGSLRINPTKTETSERTISIDDRTLTILKKWKRTVIKKNLSRGIRIDNMGDIPVISTIKGNKKRASFTNAYSNHVINKVKKHFPDMKIIKVHDFRKQMLLFFLRAEQVLKTFLKFWGINPRKQQLIFMSRSHLPNKVKQSTLLPNIRHSILNKQKKKRKTL